MGEHDLTTTEEGSLPEITVDILDTKMIIHEEFDPDYPTLANDIALLELPQEVDLTIYTPACMARTSETTITFHGKKAFAYGEITVFIWQEIKV